MYEFKRGVCFDLTRARVTEAAGTEYDLRSVEPRHLFHLGVSHQFAVGPKDVEGHHGPLPQRETVLGEVGRAPVTVELSYM